MLEEVSWIANCLNIRDQQRHGVWRRINNFHLRYLYVSPRSSWIPRRNPTMHCLHEESIIRQDEQVERWHVDVLRVWNVVKKKARQNVNHATVCHWDGHKMRIEDCKKKWKLCTRRLTSLNWDECVTLGVFFLLGSAKFRLLSSFNEKNI